MTEVTIKAIGRRGDGLASLANRDVFVPFTLPGETVSVSGKGPRLKPQVIITPSADRMEPKCEHFGVCGGCQLQHMKQHAYQAWKTDLVNTMLHQVGLSLSVDNFRSFEPSGRRRAVFSISRTDGHLNFGFSEAETHHIVDIEACPVLTPELQTSLESLKNFAASLPLSKKPSRMSVLSTQAGIDVAIDEIRPLSEQQRHALTRKSGQLDFARLSLNDEVLIEHRTPFLQMGLARVIPPPGSFVQADQAAEHAMVDIVCEHLSGCKTTVDLYSGIGTFALRLCEHSKVLAFEENEAALKALDRAWRETGGKLKELKTEVRNLDRRPVLTAELKRIDGLVFDPPRAGAELQTRQIAKSKVQKIAAVSCNPQTLVRDLSILIDAGYTVKRLIALDQFRYTPHIECIALLEK